MNRQRLLGFAAAAILSAGRAGTAWAEEAPADWRQRLEALEQKTSVLERRWEVDQENAANKAKETAAGLAGKDGFLIKAADGSFQVRFAGDVQADGRFYLNDDAGAFTDTFLMRRVRPTLEASLYNGFDAKIQPNFGGGASTVDDAYLEYRAFPKAKLRVGRFKAPVGLENLQSSVRLTFIERGLPTALLPNYDTGAQLSGDLWGGAVSYAAGVFNGALDGATSESDNGDRKDFAARVFLVPFKSAASGLLSDLGVGVGAITGKDAGAANAATTRLPSYRTEGQNSFFSYRSNVIASGARIRVSPQLYWYPGRFGLLSEYVEGSQEVKSTATLAAADLRHHAWQVAVSYVLTGEKTSYKGVKPRKAFDPKSGGWGAWEVAGRYSQFNADRNNFAAFVNPAASPRVARAWTGGLNWHVNPAVRVASNYTYTWFDGGAASGNRPAERALFSRFQVTF